MPFLLFMQLNDVQKNAIYTIYAIIATAIPLAF